MNIDASLVSSGEAALHRGKEKMVQMQNGCICCTLREDLLEQVRELADSKKYDYLVIESTGISEPMPVAETFTFKDTSGSALSDVARLDTLVTVRADSHSFLRNADFPHAFLRISPPLRRRWWIRTHSATT